MFIIKVDYERKSNGSVFLTDEFYVFEFEYGYQFCAYNVDEEYFCENFLGGFPIDKYRTLLKRKFNAVKYKDGNAPVIYNTLHGRIQPMIFNRREDAEQALEWVQSLRVNALLLK